MRRIGIGLRVFCVNRVAGLDGSWCTWPWNMAGAGNVEKLFFLRSCSNIGSSKVVKVESSFWTWIWCLGKGCAIRNEGAFFLVKNAFFRRCRGVAFPFVLYSPRMFPLVCMGDPYSLSLLLWSVYR
jgi:hypothetical protein